MIIIDVDDDVDDVDGVEVVIEELSACCRRSTAPLAWNSTGSAATTHINNPQNTTTVDNNVLRRMTERRHTQIDNEALVGRRRESRE